MAITQAQRSQAEKGLEKLSQRFWELREKQKLVPKERKELELIENNARILQEVTEGKIPEEFKRSMKNL